MTSGRKYFSIPGLDSLMGTFLCSDKLNIDDFMPLLDFGKEDDKEARIVGYDLRLMTTYVKSSSQNVRLTCCKQLVSRRK